MLRLPAAVLALWLAAAPAAAADPEYTLEVKPTTLKVGEAGALVLAFAPKPPWHWNKDYPAKLELAAPAGVSVGKPVLKQLEGDFKVADAGVSASFAVTATQAGSAEGTVKGKIGLCDDKVCIIKKVELAVSLVATPD
jgi:hypothetical protein